MGLTRHDIHERLVQADALEKAGRQREAAVIRQGLRLATAPTRKTPDEQGTLRILSPDAAVEDCPLYAKREGSVRAAVCHARQAANLAQGGRGIRKNGKVRKERGVTPEFPTCRPELCAVGRRVAEMLSREVKVRHGTHHDRAGQAAAQARWAGRQREVPTIDAPPSGEE